MRRMSSSRRKCSEPLQNAFGFDQPDPAGECGATIEISGETFRCEILRRRHAGPHQGHAEHRSAHGVWSQDGHTVLGVDHITRRCDPFRPEEVL